MTSVLADYLRYYESVSKPGYAILVTGEWGVGKTHQVKKCLKEKNPIYVSIFGMKSQDEVNGAVYAEYAPLIAKAQKATLDTSEATRYVGGLPALASLPLAFLAAQLKGEVKEDRIIVFDDLERSSMSLDEIMGLVSSYAENRGFRVVLIADEEKLREKFPDYPKAKEKIIGHTVKVVPEASSAFDSFALELGSAEQSLIVAQRSTILDIFATSGCNSLRVLRHTVFDLGRLLASMTTDQRENNAALNEITSIFTAFSIEIRSGRISLADLRGRVGRRVVASMRQSTNASGAGPKEEILPFIVACDRYLPIDLESPILSDQVLEDALGRGVFSADLISESVGRSAYFMRMIDIPAWKRVMSFDELDDESLSEAVGALERQFENREVTSSGEMLQIFALRMMMAANDISGRTVTQISAECLAYIDELASAGSLELPDQQFGWRDRLDSAFEGYGYWVEDGYKAEFREIFSRLSNRRREALENTFPNIVAELMHDLSVDADRFYRKVCEAPGRNSPYAYLPIMTAIDPNEFVDAWLGSPRKGRHLVTWALERRLEPHRVQHELAAERSWALEVLRVIGERRDALTGFERLRVQRLIPHKLEALREG